MPIFTIMLGILILGIILGGVYLKLLAVAQQFQGMIMPRIN